MEAFIKSATHSDDTDGVPGSPEDQNIEGQGQANGRPAPRRSQSLAEAHEIDTDGDSDDLSYPDHVTASSHRPEPMDHMLTEDGEPMLNPGSCLPLFYEYVSVLLSAELLTQVGIALIWASQRTITNSGLLHRSH
jgi:hypothetical protein